MNKKKTINKFQRYAELMKKERESKCFSKKEKQDLMMLEEYVISKLDDDREGAEDYD